MQGSSKDFHAPSLDSAFISFFRALSLIDLSDFLLHLSASSYPATAAHVYTIYLEELGGTRAERVKRRKRGKKSMSMEAIIAAGPDLAQGESWAATPPPSVGYLLNGLLTLSPVTAGKGGGTPGMGGGTPGKGGVGKAEVGDKGAEGKEARQRMSMLKSGLLVLMLDLFEMDHEGWEEISQLEDAWEAELRDSTEDAAAEEILGQIVMIRDHLEGGSTSGEESDEDEDDEGVDDGESGDDGGDADERDDRGDRGERGQRGGHGAQRQEGSDAEVVDDEAEVEAGLKTTTA